MGRPKFADPTLPPQSSIRKILMSVKFVSAILGPEMAAQILWVPRISAFFLQENLRVQKIPRLGVYGRGDFSESCWETKLPFFCRKMSGCELTGWQISIPIFHWTLWPVDLWTPLRFLVEAWLAKILLSLSVSSDMPLGFSQKPEDHPNFRANALGVTLTRPFSEFSESSEAEQLSEFRKWFSEYDIPFSKWHLATRAIRNQNPHAGFSFRAFLNLWFGCGSPFAKTTEITKTTKTTKTTQTATNKVLSAGFAEITETTKMTKTTRIQGANHGFPKPRV